MTFIVTQAGLNAASDAESKGFKLQITEIGFGSSGYIPSVNQTSLKAEFLRTTFSQSHSSNGKLFASVEFKADEAFQAKEIGYFTDKGILFAVESRNGEVISQKSARSFLSESFEIYLSPNLIDVVEISADNTHNHVLAQIVDIGAQVPSHATYLSTIALKTLTSIEHAGFYFQSDAANATTALGYPVQETGHLEVKPLADGNGVTHEYRTETGKIFTCVYHDLAWSEWTEVFTSASKIPMQYMDMSLFTGLVGYFHKAAAIDGWIDLKGGTLDRVTDKLLWDYANTTGLVIDQTTKDSDPMTYAMHFGTGDGGTTFTLPNHHLGHFVRGNPSGVAHGTTQGDAIRNISGSFVPRLSSELSSALPIHQASGAFSVQTHLDIPHLEKTTTQSEEPLGVNFNASRVVPTANENRPYTANLTAKIFRGFI